MATQSRCPNWLENLGIDEKDVMLWDESGEKVLDYSLRNGDPTLRICNERKIEELCKQSRDIAYDVRHLADRLKAKQQATTPDN